MTPLNETPGEIRTSAKQIAADSRMPDSRHLGLKDQLTVEAWVRADDDRLEGMQALVSKWRPPDAMDRFAAHDAAGTDGIDSTGYFGAVFDGRYAYFVPRQIDMSQYHSRILRLDTQGEFKDPSSWSAFDVGEAHSQQSAAFDGRYIYFCPGFSNDPETESDYSSRVIRYDTQGEFNDRASYTTIDIAEFLGPRAACFDGGAFDGRYIYLVPLYESFAVRYDTRTDFDDPDSWQGFDAGQAGMGENVGAVFDGRHLYYCAYGHANIVRYDTGGDFDDPESWESHQADHTGGLRTTGFDGGFFDGRFVYFQPFYVRLGDGTLKFHSHYLRYDPTRPFDEDASWQSHDASSTDNLHSVGYNGGAFDGRYFYAAPWQQGRDPADPDRFITHGIVLRCDTLGGDGSFSLRYCDCGHNGGLNAAAVGPSFLVNTDNGVLGVAAHHKLAPGRHHLAGTYDGRRIKLYIDGKVVAERSGRGVIIDSDLPVVLGKIQDGLATFRGKIDFVRVVGADYSHTHRG